MDDRISIAAAERIGKDHGYDQVIIYARRVGEPGLEWVTTWGKDRSHCDAAARIGDAIGRQVVKPIEERDAELTRLRGLLQRADEVLGLVCSGGEWGMILAWIVNGAPVKEDGIAAAKKIVSTQRRADTIVHEIHEATHG
jgi:hypothetical protein